MKCPHCQSEFALTWKRYASAPLGDYKCPQCGKTSHLTKKWQYWMLMILACCLAGVPLAFYVESFYFGFGAFGWLVGAVLVGFPIDKYLDAKWGELTITRRGSKSESESKK